MKENKKIVNATTQKAYNISFKSKLEKRCYELLIEAGYHPLYEGKTFTLIDGFTPTKPFISRVYNRKEKRKVFSFDRRKILPITYTPDFTFMVKDVLVIIECKGFENDVFPVKKKLFRRLLEEEKHPVIFYEVFALKDLKVCIEQLNRLKHDKEFKRDFMAGR